MNFLVMPLFFFSNALFPTDGLPRPLQLLVRINPLSYGIDGLRGALSQNARFGFGTDFLVLSALTAVFLAIGSYLFSKIQL
jgi:ABC-2 type transport system permease protein